MDSRGENPGKCRGRGDICAVSGLEEFAEQTVVCPTAKSLSKDDALGGAGHTTGKGGKCHRAKAILTLQLVGTVRKF